jgi:AmpD protein
LRRAVWYAGWWRHARRVRSPNFGVRPAGVDISLVVVHSISLPPGEFGGDAIECLFTNRLDPRAHPAFAALEGLRVSAHFLIRRTGHVTQFVSCDDRAWHAGTSMWQGRNDCNDWSIGIELEGLEGGTFEHAQYASLRRIVTSLASRYPLSEIVGHEHVAPGRKADPGARFDWSRVARDLGTRLRVAPCSPADIRDRVSAIGATL